MIGPFMLINGRLILKVGKMKWFPTTSTTIRIGISSIKKHVINGFD